MAWLQRGDAREARDYRSADAPAFWRRRADCANPRVEQSPYSQRVDHLHAMLQKQPNDPFLLYGIAMEHKKFNEPAQAIDFLNRVILQDANYCYAYYQLGQIFESTGDAALAIKSYNDGIAAAK